MKQTLIILFLILSLSGFSQNFFWSHTSEDICFGYLYNWYTTEDSRNITSNDAWTVPNNLNLDGLVAYFGGSSVAGAKAKKEGFVFWEKDDIGDEGTNDYGLSLTGAGTRNGTDGVFVNIKRRAEIPSVWTINPASRIYFLNPSSENTSMFVNFDFDRKRGRSIRLVSDATGVTDGSTTTYTGNDGKIYQAIAINELYWTTENLEETEYRNGDTIPNVTDNTAWSNLTTGAWCTYNNSETYKCK